MGKEISSLMAKELKKIFGDKMKPLNLQINPIYEKECKKYYMEIEKSGEKAGKSNNNLRFKEEHNYSPVNP